MEIRAISVLIGQHVDEIDVAYLVSCCIRYELRQRGRCHVGGGDSVTDPALDPASPIGPSGS